MMKQSLNGDLSSAMRGTGWGGVAIRGTGWGGAGVILACAELPGAAVIHPGELSSSSAFLQIPSRQGFR